ncbi:hypothetical protein L0337_20750 [candidate division KSB1 bacterium]|nr:hypothetical protein [candidate division KSB1 bacterium]
MKLNAPTQTLWLIAVILGVLGIVGRFVTIAYVSTYSFWLVAVGFVVLVVGTKMKGL